MSNIEDLINGLELEEPCGIETHIICKVCMEEVKANHPDVSPEHYSRLAVGFGGWGVVVWCLRHNRKVEELPLDGGYLRRLPY